MRKENKGITLIALVITIIVMLILVGVTISMAVNGGLFEKAGEAAGGTNNAVQAEQALSDGAITVGGEDYNSIGEYMQEIQKEVTVIEFTINGEDAGIEDMTLKAEEGMTWGQWVNSKYNTIGAFIDEGDSVKVVINGTNIWIGWMKYSASGGGAGSSGTGSNMVIQETSETFEYNFGTSQPWVEEI